VKSGICRLCNGDRNLIQVMPASKLRAAEDHVAKLTELFADAKPCGDDCDLAPILAWVDPADRQRTRELRDALREKLRTAEERLAAMTERLDAVCERCQERCKCERQQPAPGGSGT
jgi:hypothetical protein